jgi:hypothetical protein
MAKATINIKALKAVGLFASEESARYYLRGVLVTATPRAVLYVATDGHRMLVHREDLEDDAEPNTLVGRWIIPNLAIYGIKGGTGRFRDAPGTLSQISETELRIDGPKGSVVCTPIDGTFPDFHRVIPRAMGDDTKPGHNQFNLIYGASFAKAAELLGYGQLAPHFHQAEIGGPLPVTFGDNRKTFGVLMSVRGRADGWNGAPDWLNLDPVAVAMVEE